MSLEQFTTRAEAAGSRVEMVADWTAVSDVATRLASRDRVVVAPSLAALSPELMAALGSAGRLPDPTSPAESVADAEVGVVAADLAVAETGSVLVFEDDLTDRVVSMLSLTLIQVVPRERIVDNLDDVAARLSERPAAYAVLATASSRTADIERSLTIGVQGPAEVLVAVLG